MEPLTTHEPLTTRTDFGHTDSGTYLPPISFQELHEAGRLVMPGADLYAEGYGPLGDPAETMSDPTDRLAAFVEAWAAAGPSPAEPILPR